MQSFIPPLLLLIVLFIGFGLTHRRGQGPASCSGCAGTDCSDKSECSKKDRQPHQ